MINSASAPARAEISFSACDPQLIRIRDLIYQVAGIFQPDNKLLLLQDRCSKRMKLLSVDTLHEYYECLTTKAMRQAEITSLLN